MEPRFRDDDLRDFPIAHAASLAQARIPRVLAERTYTARLLGSEPALVLHGGGNTSAKGKVTDRFGASVDVLYVKGSGWDLATIEPAGHPAVRIAPLLKLRALPSLSDEDMVNELRLALLDATGPTPSVETLLHAYLPPTFVDHTHADAVLALADQPDAERICREVYGAGLVFVPYVMPGFKLATRTAAAYDAAVHAGNTPTVIVLERHGVFTFGETAKASYESMIRVVTLAEEAIARARTTRSTRGLSPSIAPARPTPAQPSPDAVRLLPHLRGALARKMGFPGERGPILSCRTSEGSRAFLARPDAGALVARGCATPDHVLRTKPAALFFRADPSLDGPSLDALLERELDAYAADYDAYFRATSAAKGVTRTRLDPWPRVVLLPTGEVIAIGKTLAEASAASDVYDHTMRVMDDASAVGTYAPVSREDLFDVEYWSLEQAKLKKPLATSLGGAVAVVTGAASGIGLATARKLLEGGAHVALLDRDEEALERAAAPLLGAHRAAVLALRCDVARAADVEASFAAVVVHFGGVDVVVSNAGTAEPGRLDTEAGESALRSSLDVNLLSHVTVARVFTGVARRQATGGSLLFNASKSAFNPGPDFGPYAVAKAALVSLMRQLAIDSAKVGIRSNAVNADRIRTGLFAGGVAEARARARGIPVDAYFRSNLLEREVQADDVADAFVYLAGARATTGCVVTVDGGNAAAFPR